MDTTTYRPTTLERGSRCIMRGRRFLRGRREDDRTRRSDRHSWCFLQYRRRSGDDRGRERSATDIIAGSTSLPTSWIPCCSSVQQLKLRTRSGAATRTLGSGPHNVERYNQRAGRPEDQSKGFIAVAGPKEWRPFFLGAT